MSGHVHRLSSDSIRCTAMYSKHKGIYLAVPVLLERSVSTVRSALTRGASHRPIHYGEFVHSSLLGGVQSYTLLVATPLARQLHPRLMSGPCGKRRCDGNMGAAGVLGAIQAGDEVLLPVRAT